LPNRTRLSHMASTNVFIQVLLTSETLASVSIAVGIRTKERCFSGAVLLVHFALVTEKSSRIGEALKLLAARLGALVGPLVFIHMLIPFAPSAEGRRMLSALFVIAVYLVIFVSRRLLGSLDRDAVSGARFRGLGRVRR
jgi:hypothetical protein